MLYSISPLEDMIRNHLCNVAQVDSLDLLLKIINFLHLNAYVKVLVIWSRSCNRHARLLLLMTELEIVKLWQLTGLLTCFYNHRQVDLIDYVFASLLCCWVRFIDNLVEVCLLILNFKWSLQISQLACIRAHQLDSFELDRFKELFVKVISFHPFDKIIRLCAR